MTGKIYNVGDVAEAAGVDVRKVSYMLTKHGIGSVVRNRRQLTADELQHAVEMLKNAKPGNPDFGTKWIGGGRGISKNTQE